MDDPPQGIWLFWAVPGVGIGVLPQGIELFWDILVVGIGDEVAEFFCPCPRMALPDCPVGGPVVLALIAESGPSVVPAEVVSVVPVLPTG